MDETARRAGGQLGEYAYNVDADMRERSFADIIKSIIANVQEIIRAEVRLAKAELREEGGKATDAARNLGIAAVAGLFAGLFLLNALTFGLSEFMPLWVAAGIVGLVLGVVALVLFNKGREEWKKFSPTPDKTVDTVKENVEWIKTQTK